MKTLKNRWETELDNAVPALSEDLKNAPIVKAECVETRENTKQTVWASLVGFFARIYRKLRTDKKWFSACLTAGVACLLTVCIVLPLAVGGIDKPVASGTADVVAVEINPRALFGVDSKGNVTKVVAANADADVILSKDARVKELLGKPVEESVRLFVDYAARLGYIDLAATAAAPDAVRISAYSENNRLGAINGALRTYFQEMGAFVAVVENKTTESALAANFGLTIAENSPLIKDMESMSVLYSHRQAEGKDEAALETLYRENVPLATVKPCVESVLQENVARIEKNQADIEAIVAQNEAIKRHEDNPMAILDGMDYWTLQYLGFEEYTAEFNAELAKMETLLSAYESDYDVVIESYTDLREAQAKCEAMPLAVLTELLLDFTLEVFSEHFTGLIELLENIGVDMSGISKVYEAPTTVADYAKKMREYANLRYEELKDAYADVYESEHTAIAEQDYEDCVASVVAKYGSLSAYWENLQKNS